MFIKYLLNYSSSPLLFSSMYNQNIIPWEMEQQEIFDVNLKDAQFLLLFITFKVPVQLEHPLGAFSWMASERVEVDSTCMRHLKQEWSHFSIYGHISRHGVSNLEFVPQKWETGSSIIFIGKLINQQEIPIWKFEKIYFRPNYYHKSAFPLLSFSCAPTG